MNFYDFLQLFKSIQLDNHLPSNVSSLSKATQCYKKLFQSCYPVPPSNFFNDTFLDFETQIGAIPIQNKIIVAGHAFLFEEMVDIWHNDLSYSTAELEPVTGLCFFTEKFRLPRNPWNSLPFKKDEIGLILSQFVLKDKISMLKKYPEVYCFAEYFEPIFESRSEKLSIENIFKEKGLLFKPVYGKEKNGHECFNRSHWITKNLKKKMVPLGEYYFKKDIIV